MSKDVQAARYRAFAAALRAGALREVIETLLVSHGLLLDGPLAADLRPIVEHTEALCAQGAEWQAARIDGGA